MKKKLEQKLKKAERRTQRAREEAERAIQKLEKAENQEGYIRMQCILKNIHIESEYNENELPF